MKQSCDFIEYNMIMTQTISHHSCTLRYPNYTPQIKSKQWKIMFEHYYMYTITSLWKNYKTKSTYICKLTQKNNINIENFMHVYNIKKIGSMYIYRLPEKRDLNKGTRPPHMSRFNNILPKQTSPSISQHLSRNNQKP